MEAIVDGWLVNARRQPTPNCDERPPGVPPDLLVIHSISLPPGEFGGPWIEDLFLNQLDPEAHPYFREIAALRVSAHLLLRRDGEAIQFVAFDRRAWHAGDSCFGERRQCNDFSIGIELEGDDVQPFTESQYQRLRSVTAALIDHYPKLGPSRIAGHADIAPGRKADPGPQFDWRRFRADLGTPA